MSGPSLAMQEIFREIWGPQMIEAGLIYEWLLREDPERMSSVDPPQGFCIHIPVNRRDGRVEYLSVSVPPDAMGNRASDPEPYPVAAETALIGQGGSLIYIDDWGYSGVRRFYGETRASDPDNLQRLLDEILRLENQNPGDPEVLG